MTSICFQQAIDTLFEVLFGLSISSGGAAANITVPVRDRNRGVAGTPLCAYAVTECSGRFAFHKHGLFWGGPTPEMLANISAYKHLAEGVLKEALESLVCCNLSLGEHVLDGARRGFGLRTRRASFAPLPMECVSEDGLGNTALGVPSGAAEAPPD